MLEGFWGVFKRLPVIEGRRELSNGGRICGRDLTWSGRIMSLWRGSGSCICRPRVALHQRRRLQNSGRAWKDWACAIALPDRVSGCDRGRSSAVARGVAGAGPSLRPDGGKSGAQTSVVRVEGGGEDA